MTQSLAASIPASGAGVGYGALYGAAPQPLPVGGGTDSGSPLFASGNERLLHASFPSEADTLAYVDALKHSNFSQWRSLEEVAKRAGGGSCSGVVNTSVLTALYLLGLFNLCAASPTSCCVPLPSDSSSRRKRRSSSAVDGGLPPLLNGLHHNLSSLSLEQFHELPHVTTPDGGRIPIHVSVVEQVRRLWNSNPRLLSNIPCKSATASVRSSFISLSGVASGIILAYSIAQLGECYPDHRPQGDHNHKIWFFPVPKSSPPHSNYMVRSLPTEIPVTGEDDPDDGCDRQSVRMEDGRCAHLLSSDECPFMHWILINRDTRKGECVPRLCPEGKVFVEQDQMCHAVNEPDFCPEGQRLFMTAWGEAVCDCLDGMFHGADGNCHRLYEPAYCDRGTVLQFHKTTKSLSCKVDPCDERNSLRQDKELPYAKAPRNGVCYKMSSTGPCMDTHKFGYDIEKLSPACISLQEAGLARPQRSFQYSHMSFPSGLDEEFPHYEVSYVILNGSTWELMMRSVGRQKRDAHPESTGETVVKFLDTREFPQDIEEILPGLREFGLVEEGEREPPQRRGGGGVASRKSKSEVKGSDSKMAAKRKRAKRKFSRKRKRKRRKRQRGKKRKKGKKPKKEKSKEAEVKEKQSASEKAGRKAKAKQEKVEKEGTGNLLENGLQNETMETQLNNADHKGKNIDKKQVEGGSPSPSSPEREDMFNDTLSTLTETKTETFSPETPNKTRPTQKTTPKNESQNQDSIEMAQSQASESNTKGSPLSNQTRAAEVSPQIPSPMNSSGEDNSRQVCNETQLPSVGGANVSDHHTQLERPNTKQIANQTQVLQGNLDQNTSSSLYVARKGNQVSLKSDLREKGLEDTDETNITKSLSYFPSLNDTMEETSKIAKGSIEYDNLGDLLNLTDYVKEAVSRERASQMGENFGSLIDLEISFGENNTKVTGLRENISDGLDAEVDQNVGADEIDKNSGLGGEDTGSNIQVDKNPDLDGGRTGSNNEVSKYPGLDGIGTGSNIQVHKHPYLDGEGTDSNSKVGKNLDLDSEGTGSKIKDGKNPGLDMVSKRTGLSSEVNTALGLDGDASKVIESHENDIRNTKVEGKNRKITGSGNEDFELSPMKSIRRNGSVNLLQIILEKNKILKNLNQTSEERDIHRVKGITKVNQNSINTRIKEVKEEMPEAKNTNKKRQGKRKRKKGKRGRKGIKGLRRKQRKKKKSRKNLNLKPKDNNQNQQSDLVSTKEKFHSNSKPQKKEEQATILEEHLENLDFDLLEDVSLPFYLRNRGRRQAKRNKAIPGIINAPLLNQCRPGAKRDYNGHCRPKVIPESIFQIIRVRPNRPYIPTYPRIKCNKGTRLDSRGICRKTFSGLG